jgi:hypothetical protein
MTEAKSTAGKSGGLIELERAFSRAAAATAQPPVTMRMVQNVLPIWLDTIIDQDNSIDCRNAINTFTNGEECIEFMETDNNEKACMIISG